MFQQYLEVGKVTRAHGIMGEVRVQPWADSPDFLCKFKTLYVDKTHWPIQVERARVHKNMAILKFQGITDVPGALSLRNAILYIDRADAPLLTCGSLVMDVERHTVEVDGRGVELTRREFDLLHYLLENKGKVISRESLLDNVWGFDFVGETNAVDVYIRFLRSKIDEQFGVKLIHTVRGVGYVIREE